MKVSARGVAKTFPAPGGAAGTPARGAAGEAAVGYVALRDFDLQVRSGEFPVIVGPSGCGKSTALNLIGGLDRPTEGELLLDGRPIDGPGLDRGIVFQQYALFPWRTALGNVEFGLQSKGVGRAERTRIARDHLALVGLSAFADNYPHTLSGGMKQRVAIARALAYDPDVLLMDEPFAALDAQTRESLQVQLVRIWQETRKTVVFITHRIEDAVYLDAGRQDDHRAGVHPPQRERGRPRRPGRRSREVHRRHRPGPHQPGRRVAAPVPHPGRRHDRPDRRRESGQPEAGSGAERHVRPGVHRGHRPDHAALPAHAGRPQRRASAGPGRSPDHGKQLLSGFDETYPEWRFKSPGTYTLVVEPGSDAAPEVKAWVTRDSAPTTAAR
ncbi:ABC transporter ATP-binding protein [Krasilnikovia sp. M28-CT-15]|uniref:ABC transporter ATP-binding protein n=1 Tax=Krasilnikovia sp. M28-CT-15 TaxID=3373540 RepID=UPI00387606E9